MIKFDLFKKDDISLLLEGFDTSFLQVPMKRPAKSLLKFIPNGFRPEKLARFQLTKVFVEALYSREASSTEYIIAEIQRNFDGIGLETYMADKLETEYPINTYIIEISTIIFENHLVIPAHIVLMLYGIDCSEEEKKLSERLHTAFQAEREDAKQVGLRDGYNKAEAKFASDLEAERKKVAKLQKQVDTASTRAKEDAQAAKQHQAELKKLLDELEQKKKEIADLSAALKEEQDKLAALQDLDKSQKTQISNMKIELGKAQAALKESLSQIARLTEEASTKFTVSPEELKAICVAAIDFISLKNASKEDILALAQKRFSESDNVAVAWRALCEDSIELIDELFETLSNNNFELSYFDKFIKLESLLLLELAIKQALCTVAHKTMASSTDGNTSCGNFSVQG